MSSTLLLAGCAYREDPPEQRQLAADLVELTGLEHERIEINPAEVVAVREPRAHHRVLPAKANCAVMTTDGKFISVLETCPEVTRRLEQSK